MTHDDAIMTTKTFGFACCVGGLVTAFGACGSQSELTFTLRLSDSVYAASSTARIVISGAEGFSFPAMPTPVRIADGLFLSGVDVDDDGQVDEVLETTSAFALKKVTQFTIQPSDIHLPVNVTIRAEMFDGRLNRVARIGGATRTLDADHVTAVLSPTSRTSAPDLSPACVAICPDATASYGQVDVAQAIDLAATPPTALAAGALVTANRTTLAIGAGEAATPGAADRVAQPRAGRLEVWNSAGGALTRLVAIIGNHAGDRLGAALATADLDGDGLADLVVGAPGEDGNRGGVWVLYGPLSASTALSGKGVAHASGATSGALLGAALSIFDLDGDGKPEVVVGAPGTDAVYVLHSADVPRGRHDLSVPSAGVSLVQGTAGSQFGAAVHARRGTLAIGAPLEAAGAAYIVSTAALLDGMAHPLASLGASRWLGQGGGFGRAVLLADIDGKGALAFFVSADVDGAGRILSRRIAGLAAGDADATLGVSSMRGGLMNGGLGTSLTLLPGGLGDRVLFGAPASSAAPGVAYALPSATPAADPGIVLDAQGRPAGIVVAGGQNGDGFGNVSIAGDFNQDGALDFAIGAAGAGTVSIVTGPIF